MNVKILIEKLSALDPNATVFVHSCIDEGSDFATEVIQSPGGSALVGEDEDGYYNVFLGLSHKGDAAWDGHDGPIVVIA